ncbi:MAG TPA: HupE/UreJ family protein [Polyangia bacterium]|nr:HupE/UreJ family protein [Polyangia bacterium]
MKPRRRAAGFALLIALGAGRAAFAHKPSESHLALPLRAGGGDGRWDIAIRDLDDALALDADGDGNVTWAEVRAREAAIAATAASALKLTSDRGPCRLAVARLEIAAHSDGNYASLPLAIDCPAAARAVVVDDRLLFDVDPRHRVLVSARDQTFVLSRADHAREIQLGPAVASSIPGFIAEGALHIWAGLDHVLFLLALLLPAVLRREDGHWAPLPRLRPALADVARIVTAFSVAHSLTLSLAALGLVSLPARLTEPAIAASVVIASINNLRPVFGRDRWLVAFALGLLHGFGFSSVLADGGLTAGHLLSSLLGFNLGVELGQLAVVAAFVPAAFLVRRSVAYHRVALIGGSTAIALVATVWFVARVFEIPQWS